MAHGNAHRLTATWVGRGHAPRARDLRWVLRRLEREHRHQRRVSLHVVEVDLRQRDLRIAEQRVLVDGPGENVLEGAQVEVVEVLQPLGDLLAVEITADQVAGEEWPGACLP